MPSYKVNISFPPELVDDIDRTAEELGMTRSGFVAEASARYIADVRQLSAEELRRKDVERATAIFRDIAEELPSDIRFVDQLRRDRGRGRGREGGR